MRLWTIQNEDIYQRIEKKEPILEYQPNQFFSDFNYQWFIEKTGFTYMPLWCWFNTPDLQSIEEHYQQHLNNNQKSYILELNVPNNEKMVFFSQHAFDYVSNYLYLDNTANIESFNQYCDTLNYNYFNQKPLPHHDLHQKIQHSWSKIFDHKWCEKMFQQSPTVVCIQTVHPHWLVKKYTVTEKLISQLKSDLKRKKEFK